MLPYAPQHEMLFGMRICILSFSFRRMIFVAFV